MTSNADSGAGSRLFPVAPLAVESDDYVTPAWLFERMAIRFDLDVCTPRGGVPWIPADRWFTLDDDGLEQPWTGRVWMNPPYSDSTPWVERFIAHRNGVALVQHCRSRWHSRLWATADALADPNPTPSGSMFQFWRDGVLCNVYMPVVLAAFGAECVEAIRRVGPSRTLSP
jgi:DNA N-6-adenine-methyltransferase (Dam)